MQRRKSQPGDVKLSVTVPENVWERLHRRAIEERRSLNDLLNEWITEKLRPQFKPEPEASQPAPPADEGQKGGSVTYAPNLRTASVLCDRSG